MNLWVKRVGQLAVLAVALFFFSCEEQTSLIGFPNPDSKYKTSFIDIPIKSSNLLFDSVRTTNYYATNDVNRLLVGHYNDPVFGDITAKAFTQFVPNGGLIKDSTVYLVYDSASIQLSFDFYAYGTDGETSQKINIYEIEDPLEYSNKVTVPGNVGGQQKPVETNYYRQREYYNNSDPAINPTLLASNEFLINYDKFNTEGKYRNISMTLNEDFGERLFQQALKRDSTFTRSSIFTTYFPGLAVVPAPGECDKIFGFNPSMDTSTFIKIHYHSKLLVGGANKDTLTLRFKLSMSSGFISFNKIEVDRSSTDLAGLVYNVEDSVSEKRYIEGGTGVVTKIDFSAYLDSLKNIPRLAINSAELIISNIDDPQHLKPPSSLLVKLLKNDNRPKKLAYPGKASLYQKDIEDINAYNGFINFDNRNTFTLYNAPFDSTFNIINDQGSFLTLNYSEDNNNYKGKASLFFNRLHVLSEADDNTLYTKAVLIPYVPSSSYYGRHINGKTLNGISFNKDNIKLRVYYTIPTIPQNE